MSAEKLLQQKYGSKDRADQFEHKQKLTCLNEMMINFIADQSMMFIATADKEGNCDNSIRTGMKGFVQVLNPQTLAYPEYRGNGVYASLGNIVENPHIGLLFIDFFETRVGLHVNGRAEIVENFDEHNDPLAERWVKIEVEEAYIHCSKHIPKCQILNQPLHWNSDDEKHKGGDFFKVSESKKAEQT